MYKKIKLLVFSLFLVLSFSSLIAQQTKRVFMIGNSVTDGVKYHGLQALAEDPTGPGNTHVWSRHMIPGSPLFLLWDASVARNGGFVEAPYGYPSDAFVNYQWDAITLQPFDRHLIDGDPVTGQGDVAQCNRYANLAKTMSPNVQFYILGRYPRASSGVSDPANDPASTADSWNALHTRAYTGGWDGTNETRDYYEKLADAATTANPGLTKPFRIIPLGEVMSGLNAKMKAGQVPGYNKIWQFYADGIHLNLIGSYVNACTFYATIYKESPVGRIVPSDFGSINPALALIIQQTVWEVVSTYPQAGIFGVVVVPISTVSVTPTSISVAINQTYQLSPTVAPSNASNQNLTWSSSNNAIATVSSTGLITGKGVGTANITVSAAADPSKTSTCEVTVVAGSIAVTGITISPATASIKLGNSSSLTLNVLPNNATDQSVVWSSSNPIKATVNTNGVVTALETGTATITATSVSDGSKTASCAVTVLPNAAPVAVIGASVLTGAAPLVVNFNSAGSSDADAGDYVLGFEWNFGDGSAIEKSSSPSHTFTSEGTYTVKLRVMDNNNLYGSIVNQVITVTPNLVGVNLATWDFANWNPTKAAKTFAAPSTIDSNITVSNLQIGVGLDGSSNYFSDNALSSYKMTSTSLAQSITNKEYYEFTVTPKAGKSVSIYSIDVAALSQGEVCTFSLLSSLNGFTAANLISSITTGTGNNNNILLQKFPVTGHMDLTSAVTFRIYIYSSLNLEWSAMGVGVRNPSQAADMIVKGSISSSTELGRVKELSLKLHPNPASDRLTLDFAELVQNASISIIDLQGRSIMTATTNKQSETLNIADLKSGIYFVKVLANGKILNSRFVKK